MVLASDKTNNCKESVAGAACGEKGILVKLDNN
jgi:hypothetical protein